MTNASISLHQQADYRFEIHFSDNIPHLIADEPAPLGKGEGPSPTQLLCASVGNCLSDLLLFALRKFKQAPEPLRCEVQAEVGRNPEGRLRNLGIHATTTWVWQPAPWNTCTGHWLSSRRYAPSRKACGRPCQCVSP